MKKTAVAAISVTALLGVAAVPATAGAAGSFTKCENAPLEGRMKAQKVSCAKARQVIKGYLNNLKRGGEFDQTVLSFHCVGEQPGNLAIVKCTMGSKRINWDGFI